MYDVELCFGDSDSVESEIRQGRVPDQALCSQGAILDARLANFTSRSFSIDPSSVPQTFAPLALAAASQWNRMFSSRGVATSMTDGLGDILIKFLDSTQFTQRFDKGPPTNTIWDRDRNEIVMRDTLEMRTGSNEYLQALFLHEFGHVWGFTQEKSGPTDSVMIDTTQTSFRATFTACDYRMFTSIMMSSANTEATSTCERTESLRDASRCSRPLIWWMALILALTLVPHRRLAAQQVLDLTVVSRPDSHMNVAESDVATPTTMAGPMPRLQMQLTLGTIERANDLLGSDVVLELIIRNISDTAVVFPCVPWQIDHAAMAAESTAQHPLMQVDLNLITFDTDQGRKSIPIAGVTLEGIATRPESLRTVAPNTTLTILVPSTVQLNPDDADRLLPQSNNDIPVRAKLLFMLRPGVWAPGIVSDNEVRFPLSRTRPF
jgi:hypothetical protein